MVKKKTPEASGRRRAAGVEVCVLRQRFARIWLCVRHMFLRTLKCCTGLNAGAFIITSGSPAGTTPLQLEEEYGAHAPPCHRHGCFSLRDREYSNGLQSKVLARLHAYL